MGRALRPASKTGTAAGIRQPIRRYRSVKDRREVRLTLTASGRALVSEVTQRRRTELARLVSTMAARWHEPVVAALRWLSTVAGEMPEDEWWLGWATGEPDEAGAAVSVGR